MTTPAACLVTFSSAAIVDGLMTEWVRAVAADDAVRAAVLSMAMAMALLTGIGEALLSYWPGVTWVLGYGAGSYVAVKLGGAK